MAIILNIETSTRICSVSVAIDGVVESIIESNVKNAHAESVTIFSESVLKEAGISFSDLSAIAVSKGPGSYTGLRIGVSTAKGFCYALDKPLISISTLQAMAFGMVDKVSNSDYLFCPMIDARRMEVYTAIYNKQLLEIEETSAKIIDDSSFENYLDKQKVVFAGDGAEKCQSILSTSSNAIFLDDFNPSSAFMAKLSENKFNNNLFEDVVYFEPFYLKDFVAGVPKVKGLQ